MNYLIFAIFALFMTGTSAVAQDAPFHMNKVLRNDQGEVMKVDDHAIELDEWPRKKYMKVNFIIQGKEKNPTCTIKLKLVKGKTSEYILNYQEGKCKIKTSVEGDTASMVETPDSQACIALAKDRKGASCGITSKVDLNGSYRFGF